MKHTTRALLATALAASSALSVAPAAAQPGKLVIGFLTDISGPYGDLDGKNGAVAIQMAIDDFGGKVNGQPVELLVADNQNKPDIAVAKAREWYDTQGMSMLVGGTNSAAALALSKLTAERKRVFIVNGSGSSALTNEQCSPYTIHYAWDSVAQAKVAGGALTRQGLKDWFFLSADYAFGQALEADASKVIKANGGHLVGSVKHPINTLDFSSFLLKAQNSKAQVIGLANGGADTINAIKSAREFGIDKSMRIASLVLFISDVHSLGLPMAQGLTFTTSWDWSLDEPSRAFGRRFFEKTQRMPTEVQAANYSATMNYLKAVQATGSIDGDRIMDWFRKTPLKDFYAQGVVRPDGRYVHNMYLMQVKTPAESTAPWDYVKRVATVPGDEAFTTKAESRCPLWK